MKFVEAANNFKKLAEVRKNFAKFLRFANNFTKFVDTQTTFMKVVEAANNFAKFVGLANNFWKVRKTGQKLMKFAGWKVGFKCLKVFLYLSFTRSNILIGKHKCFVNTFHVSCILFTNKLNSGRYIRLCKIFWIAKKSSLVSLDRWSFYVV